VNPGDYSIACVILRIITQITGENSHTNFMDIGKIFASSMTKFYGHLRN